jgi:hypothetical protein
VQDTMVEHTLSQLGVKVSYEAEYKMNRLVVDDATQVRFVDNRAPGKEVDRYYDLLTAGAEFPPVVADTSGRLIDGNTRYKATFRYKRSVIPAYICSDISIPLARRIGVELNGRHGRRMAREELSVWIAEGNGSVSVEDARRLTGWSAAVIRRIQGAQHFNKRCKDLDFTVDVALPETIRAALNQVNDPRAFRELTRLAVAAGLKEREVRIIVVRANDAAKTNPEAALTLIRDQEKANVERIADRRAGLTGTTPLFNQLSMHLGWIIKQGPSGLYDANIHTGSRSQALIENSVDVLRDALERYR